MGKIQLTNLSKSKNRVDYIFTVSNDLCRFFKDTHLFCQYDRIIEHIPDSILVIPFLGNVMQIAWLTNSDVYIDTVDSIFFESLSRLKKAYQKMYPNIILGGNLHVKQQDHSNIDIYSAKKAQMFTGGMDAVTTFIRHQSEHPLLILEYGFYDISLIADDAFSNDKKSDNNFISDSNAASRFASQHNVDTAFIRANYGTFINSSRIDKRFAKSMNDYFWHGLHHAMAILSAAAPIAYSEGVSELFIASSFSIGNTYPCASDPTTDNEFRFGNTRVIHDGYELTDQDKARIVVSYQKKIGEPLPLRVCSWNDHNCCQCEKCLRRMLQLSAEGGDPKQFGFNYGTNMLCTLQSFLNKEVQFFTTKNIDKWQKIIFRMSENYDHIFAPEIYDYLQNYNFIKEKKSGLYRYYRTNFFSILKRKISHIFKRR